MGAVAEWTIFGLLGAVLGVAYVVAVLRLAPSPSRAFAVGLVVAAAVYPVFALAGGAPWPWLAIELVGLAAFGALAFPAARFGLAPVAVAAGWALHPLWDMLLHATAVGAFPAAAGAGHVPSWYPPACATFDWIVALAAATRAFSPRR